MSEHHRLVRVLHVVGRRPDAQTERAIQSLTNVATSNAGVLAVGPGAGLWGPGFTLTPNLAAAVRTVRRVSSDLDTVQTWDGRALATAIAGGCRRIVFSPQSWPTPRSVRWLRAAMNYREIQVVCPSATMRRYYAERGVPLERLDLARPGVDFSRVRRQRDPALRAALGIAPDDYVILLPGDSTDAADHYLGVWTGSILACLDGRVRVLMHGRGERAGSAMRLGAKLGQARMVCNADEALGRRTTPEELTAAADVALMTATGGGHRRCDNASPAAATMPVMACMAAALPIVSVVTPTLAELLEDRHTALMTPQPKARLLAAKLLSLRDDPALARQLADTAAAEAYELLSLSKIRDAWREVYDKVARTTAAPGPVRDAGGDAVRDTGFQPVRASHERQ